MKDSDHAAMERFESCRKRGKKECPFLPKMKTVKKGIFSRADETMKLNDIMEDAAYCKDCPVFEPK